MAQSSGRAPSGGNSGLLPELRLGDVLQQRNGGLGSPAHIIRLGIAVTVAWLVAITFSRSSLGIFAPVTTLLVLQSSPWSTLGLSLQRILGTGIGVLVASVWVNLVGLSWWSFLIAVVASLFVARMIPWSVAGQIQIPIAVVFVLALGPGSMQQDIWRVLDVVIGGVIGLLAVYLYPAKPKPAEFERALTRYRDAILAVLASVGHGNGLDGRTLEPGMNHDYIDASRALRSEADTARQALVKLAESSFWNPRGREVAAGLDEDARRLRRLGGIGVQVRGISGAANLLFDRGVVQPLTPQRFGELIDQVVRMARVTLGADGAPLTPAGEQAIARESEELSAELDTAARHVMVHAGDVQAVIDAIALLGRIDHIRRQLLIYSTWTDDSSESDQADD
ncbi:MAG: hypothetical protein RL205_1748 [Actinomycetota bacterium]|jgi:hypothetical protein